MKGGVNYPFIQVCRPNMLQLTYLMDQSEFGAFMRLYLAHYDYPDGIPLDEQLLMRLTRCTRKVWARVRPVVLEKFDQVEKGGRLFLTLEGVLEDVLRINEKSSSARANVMKRHDRRDTPVTPPKNVGTTNSKLQETEFQTPNSSASPPAPVREEPPAGSGDGGESANEFAGEEEFVVHNGKIIPRRIGDTAWNDALKAYEANPPPKPQKRAEKVVPVAVQASPSMPRFRVMDHLDDAAQRKARDAAPGWDLYRLAEIYDANIAKGTHEIPRNAKTAFPGWCKRYTAGKPPGAERRAA